MRDYWGPVGAEENSELILISQIVHKQKKEGRVMKKKKFLILLLMAGLTITLTCSSAIAEEFSVLGRSLKLFGYATQEMSFGFKDSYDTEKGLNSALMNLFVEGDYEINKDLKFYGSGMLTVDWIYQLKHNDSSWNDKLFSKSKSKLNVDDKYWQLLKEARLTWTPGDFMFRAGKQIVSWGELLAFRIMDQINPLDQRRGFLDIEFETTIIPIWLFRADYYPKIKSSWLQDLGFEFVWNPNPDFIPNQDLRAGNAEGGIWAPNITMSIPAPPFKAHIATAYGMIDTPKKWKEGNEFAFRAKANMFGAMATLNFFYGRDNSPVSLGVPPYASPLPPHIYASDGALLLHPFSEGKYPLLKFVGATIAKEITPLRASFLGDVAPTVYLEALYAFESTFAFTNPLTTTSRYDKSDDLRTGVEVTWKVKIPPLNARTYFAFTGEFFWRRIMDYPSIEVIQGLKKNNYQTFLSVNTQYFHGKLTPSFTWIHDINTNSNYFIPKLVYDLDYHWHFTLGAQLFRGAKEGKGLQLFDNKNQIFFKVAYKWG
jgi:hypothetical protein